MRGRLALLTGFAAGYVLGAKAGRERYEEIRERFNNLMGTEPAQQLQSQVRDAAARAGDVAGEKATEGINKAGEKAEELVNSAKASKASKSSKSGSDSPDSVTLP